eukprot:TRINITY_DN67276_c9_g2_i1.p1 TRINITY_DN67276_c9_g2~~TRINITY_DN67276_c9_g2_i1.p1  ORF type:complete len:284 (-),score=30.15 TRINITY_DN67276_c9_g2_i1:998-1849(-)
METLETKLKKVEQEISTLKKELETKTASLDAALVKSRNIKLTNKCGGADEISLLPEPFTFLFLHTPLPKHSPSKKRKLAIATATSTPSAHTETPTTLLPPQPGSVSSATAPLTPLWRDLYDLIPDTLRRVSNTYIVTTPVESLDQWGLAIQAKFYRDLLIRSRKRDRDELPYVLDNLPPLYCWTPKNVAKLGYQPDKEEPPKKRQKTPTTTNGKDASQTPALTWLQQVSNKNDVADTPKPKPDGQFYVQMYDLATNLILETCPRVEPAILTSDCNLAGVGKKD